MRDVAREERAGAGPADLDLVDDLEGDLTGQHPGDLVAVAVQMEHALGTDRHGFFEQHDALIGLVADELQGGEAPRRPHVEVLPAVSRYHKAFGRVHSDALLVAKARRLCRAATRSDPTRDRPPPSGRSV